MTLEVAETPEQLAQGLMNRVQLPPHHGMLFVFSEPAQRGFWMKNTYIPLDIVWLDAQGHVFDQRTMQPHDETMHRPIAPAKFAVELKAGALHSYGTRFNDRLFVLKG
jgi:uncharacterized membrane protein (UPF0127 family)